MSITQDQTRDDATAGSATDTKGPSAARTGLTLPCPSLSRPAQQEAAGCDAVLGLAHLVAGPGLARVLGEQPDDDRCQVRFRLAAGGTDALAGGRPPQLQPDRVRPRVPTQLRAAQSVASSDTLMIWPYAASQHFALWSRTTLANFCMFISQNASADGSKDLDKKSMLPFRVVY